LGWFSGASRPWRTRRTSTSARRPTSSARESRQSSSWTRNTRPRTYRPRVTGSSDRLCASINYRIGICMPRNKVAPDEGKRTYRLSGSAAIEAMVARTAPAILKLLGDGVARSKSAIIAALADRPGACPSSITARRQRQSAPQAPDRARPVHSRPVPARPLLQRHPHLANLPRKRTDKAAEPVGARSEILPRSLLPQAPGQSPSKTLARAPCDRREHGSGCWAGATVGPAGS
jgi:hypothetical protein